MISVAIRTKNQAVALQFALKNLTTRYAQDIGEILVLDNRSTDDSEAITKHYGARYLSIDRFSYGGSANYVAQQAKYAIVVMFSAHSFPVSHDFFKVIVNAFNTNPNLAGVRCLHQPNDYKNYILGVTAKDNPNTSGLIFSGSAFRKSVWEKHPFRDDVATFEDKEWTVRVLKAGYDIVLAPAIFSYHIKRTKKQLFFRFKNDVMGNYQLWHQDVTFLSALKGLFGALWQVLKNAFNDVGYAFLRFFFLLKFIFNKPKQF